MKVTFWGTRGSVPSPGPDTVEYGGNTVSVEVELDTGHRLVFDAGTGIRGLGLQLTAGRGGHKGHLDILLGHYHWDHLQGIPFFQPVYEAGWSLDVWGPARGDGAPKSVMRTQMDGIHFPVHLRELRADIKYHEVHADATFEIAGARVDTIATNHPGGGVAYRVTADGAIIVYLTDNELRPPGKPVTSVAQFVEFCRGVDLLIHDAQYLPHDLVKKRGWGHSTAWQALDLAMSAAVKRLALFHHDPERTDPEVDAIVAEAKRRLGRTPMEVFAAREGLTVDLRQALPSRRAVRGGRRPVRRRRSRPVAMAAGRSS